MDLQLDPHIKLHYLVAKILYYTFVEDDRIAESSLPQLEYEPEKEKKEENFVKYSRQGIGPAAFDIILDNLIEEKTVISFSKFSSKFGESWHKPEYYSSKEEIEAHKIMAPAMNIQITNPYFGGFS